MVTADVYISTTEYEICKSTAVGKPVPVAARSKA